MREILSHRELNIINNDISALRHTKSREVLCYLVTDSVITTGDTYDPVFGENNNPWTETSGSTTYTPFQANVVSNQPRTDYGPRSEYNEGGFLQKQEIVIDVPFEMSSILVLGALLLINNQMFRVVDLENRGMINENRLIANLENVT